MKRYLLCPAGLSILHLKKFIVRKYGLPTTYRVDVMYLEDILSDDYTLMDVAYIYDWKRSDPMRLFYRISERPIKRLKTTHPLTIESKSGSGGSVNSANSDISNANNHNHSNNSKKTSVSVSQSSKLVGAQHPASSRTSQTTTSTIIMTGAAPVPTPSAAKAHNPSNTRNNSRSNGVTSGKGSTVTPKHTDTSKGASIPTTPPAIAKSKATHMTASAIQTDEPPKKLRKILPANDSTHASTPKPVSSKANCATTTSASKAQSSANQSQSSPLSPTSIRIKLAPPSPPTPTQPQSSSSPQPSPVAKSISSAKDIMDTNTNTKSDVNSETKPTLSPTSIRIKLPPFTPTSTQSSPQTTSTSSAKSGVNTKPKSKLSSPPAIRIKLAPPPKTPLPKQSSPKQTPLPTQPIPTPRSASPQTTSVSSVKSATNTNTKLSSPPPIRIKLAPPPPPTPPQAPPQHTTPPPPPQSSSPPQPSSQSTSVSSAKSVVNPKPKLSSPPAIRIKLPAPPQTLPPKQSTPTPPRQSSPQTTSISTSSVKSAANTTTKPTAFSLAPEVQSNNKHKDLKQSQSDTKKPLSDPKITTTEVTTSPVANANGPLDLSMSTKKDGQPKVNAAPIRAIYDIPPPKPKQCLYPPVLEPHRSLFSTPSAPKPMFPSFKVTSSQSQDIRSPTGSLLQTSSALTPNTETKKYRSIDSIIDRISNNTSTGNHSNSSRHRSVSHSHNTSHHNNHNQMNYSVITPDPRRYTPKIVIRNIGSPPSTTSHFNYPTHR
ncbi:unnamed protein product [Oppiella nova]|uniref:RAWUL domain-containing protein n=1 Tax=Oppiella nova TaxID=334625 RepID=A0A7R9LNG0_9ACAR|nr:unnamed protein product [Oppiella nova]CAG2165005.1 unnamed protein product [Oppiella nova]